MDDEITPPIRRIWCDHGLVIGQRMVRYFLNPIRGVLYVPERDAVAVWTKATYGRGQTRNLYCFSGRGSLRWRVAATGKDANWDRYHDVGLWDATKLLCMTSSGLVVVDLDRGTIVSPPGSAQPA